MWQTEPHWSIVEPGVIELDTTRIRIVRDNSRRAPFVLIWNGRQQGVAATLDAAKEYAMAFLNELIESGDEP
jgi:hypothetical protein